MRGHSSFWVLGVGICLTGIMLFWNLGNYSLWDDEAIDGLIARSLLENGRAEALIGKNLVGYRDGSLLHGMMIEGEPPFCAFAAIPFFGIFGQKGPPLYKIMQKNCQLQLGNVGPWSSGNGKSLIFKRL